LTDEMRTDMVARFTGEGHAEAQVTFEASAEVRYRGQASRLRMSLATDGDAVVRLRETFEKEHVRLYGHRPEVGSPIEVAAVRLVGRAPGPAAANFRAAERPSDRAGTRRAVFGSPWGTVATPVVSRRLLTEPTRGPLLIDEYDATVVVPPDFH